MLKPIKLDTLLKMDEAEIQTYLYKRMVASGRKVTHNPDFLYSPGTVPILLIAHMDTVHKQTPTVCKSDDGEIYMAPEGIGGDDRAGIYAVMKTIEKHDCHVLFTQGEEAGGVGARAFVQSGIRPLVNFIIEPDRKGKDDAVFYDCGNIDFIEFIEDTTGFKEAWGSFSDISIVAPALDRAAVNLSVGYYNQHTNYEHIKYSEVLGTIEAMDKLITSSKAKKTYTFDKIVYTYATSGKTKKYTSGTFGGGNWWDKYDVDDMYGDAYNDDYGVRDYTKGYTQKADFLPPKTHSPITPIPASLPKREPNPIYTGFDTYKDEQEEDEELLYYYIEDLARSFIGIEPEAELVGDLFDRVLAVFADWGYASI